MENSTAKSQAVALDTLEEEEQPGRLPCSILVVIADGGTLKLYQSITPGDENNC
ncbi:MAG TPA: hypothetical protein VNA22_02355 [Pyrinomonadaceae bacterium]|nr:hypothetical protein [Pyrinomonadaceae bacterium]